jgi:uncharacterized protein
MDRSSRLAMNPPEGMDADLWSRLAAEAQRRARNAEPAHDFSHVERVVANAIKIAIAEREDGVVPATAALLHELVAIPKAHPKASEAGDLSAVAAREVLMQERAPERLALPVCLAIRDHAFSKGVVPDLASSRILQDADRLDAIGAIGLARLWATCADMKRPFYSPEDPFCSSRPPDDKAWGLDHVFKKLLVVPERLHTDAARRIAVRRVAFLRTYLDELAHEIRD